MKSERWRNELCLQNFILIQLSMEGKENELVSKERICLWYIDWSGTVKLTNSSYLLSLFYSILPIYIVCMTRITKLSGSLIFQVFDYIFVII